MDFELTAHVLTMYVHAPLGGLALLTGAGAMISKKGSILHKRSGLVFFYAMLVSAITALVVSVIPGHDNPFLFCIGVFSSYFLLSGYRSLAYKKTDVKLLKDNILAFVLLATSVIMILYPIMLERKLNIVLLVFGVVGIVFSVRDIRMFKTPTDLRKHWMRLHLGKMMGGYIAATTAFFVVNNILPGIWNWFVPGLGGGIFIAYWIRKLKA